MAGEINELQTSIENLDLKNVENGSNSIDNKPKPKKRNKKKSAAKTAESVEVEVDVKSEQKDDAEEKEDEDSNDEDPSTEAKTTTTKKKNKKKKKKKLDPSEQTEPPTIPVTRFYAPSNFPLGELQEYGEDNVWRVTSAEKKYLERQNSTIYEELRRSAEAHRQVRKYARKIAKPGISMVELCEAIENGTRSLIEADGLKSGIGFPTGVSLNHCAAHYTPNPGDKTVLKQDDVLKIDFGIHVNGRIIDSAFTVTFDEKYDPLLEAVRNATYAGIKTAGIDVRLCDVGAAVQEVMESYEIELNGKTYPIKAIKNLNGHSIMPYTIHAGKSVPVSDNGDQTKMEEGEVFAIETFGSTGTGNIRNDLDCSHFAINPEGYPTIHGKPKAKALLEKIKETWGTLPFCRRYLDRIGETRHLLPLRQLVDYDIVTDYPPLVDIRGSFTAQFEHTIILRPTVKEVLSKGDDY